MIEYDRYSWWTNTFSWYGTALSRAKSRVLLFTTYSLLVQCFYQIGSARGWVSDDLFLGMDPSGHAVLGSLIGFLIVFRMNCSNDRYWEGRSHWGAIINASRNLVRIGAAYTPSGPELASLVTAYVICVRRTLQGNRDTVEADQYLSAEQCQQVQQFGNTPTGVSALISGWIHRHYRSGDIDTEQVRLLEDQMCHLVDAQGGCEKILKTPLPFAYVAMIKQLLVVYLLTLPIVLCARSSWWSPVLMAIISLGLLGMEEASVEIEDPFGVDENCLDMPSYTQTIARDTSQLGEHSQRPQ